MYYLSGSNKNDQIHDESWKPLNSRKCSASPSEHRANPAEPICWHKYRYITHNVFWHLGQQYILDLKFKTFNTRWCLRAERFETKKKLISERSITGIIGGSNSGTWCLSHQWWPIIDNNRILMLFRIKITFQRRILPTKN